MSRSGKQTAKNIKLLTIGDSAVGKTCLISQFARDSFNPNFITTIGIDYKIKEVDIDGSKYKLLIWDTAGQERFRTITTSYFRGCQGILLVYDITVKKTFDNVSNWMDQIIQVNDGQHVCKILIGNKCDMVTERKVTEAEGKKLAEEYKIPFMETSAKDNINVQEAFLHITKDVVSGLPSENGGGSGSDRGGNKADLSKGSKKDKKKRLLLTIVLFTNVPSKAKPNTARLGSVICCHL
jgi:Ras-related protein Rab-8A